MRHKTTYRLISLISLTFCVNLAFGQTSADTCLTKTDVSAARVYVRYLENVKRHSDIEVALLRLKTNEQSKLIGVLTDQNINLSSALTTQKRSAKYITWAVGVLGVVIGLTVVICHN